MSLPPPEAPSRAWSPLPPPPALPAPPPPRRGGSALLVPAAALLCIGFSVWLGLAATDYRARHAQTTAPLALGSTHQVEVKVNRATVADAACASDARIAGLGCAFQASKAPALPSRDEEHALRPYSTVRGEVILGAGLFRDPRVARDLPDRPFTVVCTFRVAGFVKTPLLRFKDGAAFTRGKTTLAAGPLTDCAVPR